MMGDATYPAPAIRAYGEQLSLTTALASLGIPPGYRQARVYVPSTDFRLNLNPAISAVRFYDASASAGARFVDVWASLVDRATGTGTGSTMNDSTTSDFLYVCFSDIAGGMRVTIGNANGNTTTIAGEYLKNDGTWAGLTETDGTASGGATLAVTGSVTWTVPTDWLLAGVDKATITDTDRPTQIGFWTRFSWSAALDDATSITELWSLNEDTNRGYFYLGQEYHISLDRRRVGALEAVLASGTDTLDVTWVRT